MDEQTRQMYIITFREESDWKREKKTTIEYLESRGLEQGRGYTILDGFNMITTSLTEEECAELRRQIDCIDIEESFIHEKLF